MNTNTKLTIYADHSRNTISRHIFGHFMEHASNVIYGGIFDPGHALADEDGFRKDVLDALREIRTPMLRYPGGNFVSNYHWEDGIGPVEKRPRVFDYAWLTEDDNRMGTIEFILLCRKVGAEPYICVNMGSGTAEEAMNWVEFCNGTGNSKYAKMRKDLGYTEPFHVKYWGLGNEMYGDWQFGTMNAEDHAKKALDFAKAMKWVDPTIELIACGYDLGNDWNYITAQKLKSLIHSIAIHHYSIGYGIFDEENYEQCMYIPEYIQKLTDVARASIVAGTNDALSEIKVSWDEWNTHAWNLENEEKDETYDLKNAIMTASILHVFLKNSDLMEICSYSPFVNKCGAISVKEDGILKRAQYYVFKLLAEAFEKCSCYLETRMECEMTEVLEVIDFSNRLPEAKFSLDAKSSRRIVKTPNVDCVAAKNEAGTEMVISLLNKSLEKNYSVDVTIFGENVDWSTAKAYEIYHDELTAANTRTLPEEVVIREADGIVGEQKVFLKKHSLTVITLKIS